MTPGGSAGTASGSYRADEEIEPAGVWVAFNYGGSAFVPFASEVEAYRYAAGYHMTVKFARYGDDEWMRS